METKDAKNHWVIWLSFVFAFLLTVVPMPDIMDLGRPQWVALLLIYWVVALPEHIGMVYSFIIGLLLDVLLGSTLGVHAMGFCVQTYILQLNYQRIRMFQAFQQAMVVLLLIVLTMIIIHYLQAIYVQVSVGNEYLIPSIFSAFFWPWLYILLRNLRQKFGVQ